MIPHIHWQNFLPPDLLISAQQVASEKRDGFIPSEVMPPRPNYRSSHVLLPSHYLNLHGEFTAYLLSRMAEVVHLLRMDMTDCCIDLQMTRHGNGDFFKMHLDAGNDETSRRRISFVHYFNLTKEKMFLGGDLRLYSGLGHIGRVKFYNPFPLIIQPDHNSIVFFPSYLLHKVKKVCCSNEWEDGRLSLNGWVNSTA